MNFISEKLNNMENDWKYISEIFSDDFIEKNKHIEKFDDKFKSFILKNRRLKKIKRIFED